MTTHAAYRAAPIRFLSAPAGPLGKFRQLITTPHTLAATICAGAPAADVYAVMDKQCTAAFGNGTIPTTRTGNYIGRTDLQSIPTLNRWFWFAVGRLP